MGRRYALAWILLGVLSAAPVVSANALDTTIFGDADSEAAHGLAATRSEVVQDELMLTGAGSIGGGVGMGRMGGGNEDAFFFRSLKLDGDGFIQARVASRGSGDRQVRTGLMMREALTPTSKMVFALDNTWDQFGPGVVTRATDGAAPSFEQFEATTRPLWLRVERKADVFTTSASADGETWRVVSNQTVPMNRAVYMGLTTTAQSPEKSNEAVFDRVTTSAPNAEWSSQDVGPVLRAGKAEVMGLGERSRKLLPLETPGYYGGDLTFRMKVDPEAQNYFTIKIWGSEGNGNRIVLTCEDKEIGQRHGAGADILVNGGGAVSPGSFWYRTTVIPKWLSEGKTSVEIKLRSTGSLYAYGRIWNYDTYQKKLETPTRGLYRVYTHTNPVLTPVGERQGVRPEYGKAPVRKVDEQVALQKFKDGVNERLKKIQGNVNSKSNDIEFLANAYDVTWTVTYRKPETVNAAVKIIDEACRKFTADPKHAGGEWGGTFGGHGVAIHRLLKVLGPQLKEKVDLGAGLKPRREQWIAMLVASRDYGRMNRKTIANQAIACDTAIYGANKGLQALTAKEAYPEPKARRYLREAAGLEPYTYSEKEDGSVAPPKDFPLTHRMVTSKGTTHEWNWCCHNCYGRMSPYVYEMYRLSGDTDLRDRAVQMERAHVNQVYASVDSGGFRAMLNEGVICTRNVYHPGNPGYPYVNVTSALVEPALINGVRQQLADGQFFNSWVHNESSVFLPDDLTKIKARFATTPNRPMPTTPGQPDCAWADEQNAILTIKHKADTHFITFARRSEIGLHRLVDVHSLTPQFERVIQFAVDDMRHAETGAFTTVGPEVQTPFTGTPPDKPVSAWAGQKLPRPPGRNGSPADFYGTRFGDFLIGMNSSYDKKVLFAPPGFKGGTDLISGKPMTAPVTVPPQATVVFFAPQQTGESARSLD